MSVRLIQLGKALRRLREALDLTPSDVARDAAIQRFEFCADLAWKAVQATAREMGRDCRFPKDCLRLAFEAGWVDDEAGWLRLWEDRNLTSHTYDEELAEPIYRRLPEHLRCLESLDAALVRHSGGSGAQA